MPDLVSDGGEFSCNHCTSKLTLTVISSSTSGDSKKLATQTNCFLPPPGGQCTFPPGVTPSPCPGVPPGCVSATGQSIVKIDGQTALGEGCKFICPKGQVVSLSKAGQTIGKHNEANGGAGGYIVGGLLVVGGVALAVLLLPEEVVAGAIAGLAVTVKAVAKIGSKAIKKAAGKTKRAPNISKNIVSNSNKPSVTANSNKPSVAANSNKPSVAANSNKPAKNADNIEKIKKSAKQRNLDGKRKDGTPGNNQAQNKEFDGACKTIEKNIGRKLSKSERRQIHDEISGNNYTYHDIVEEGTEMFRSN